MKGVKEMEKLSLFFNSNEFIMLNMSNIAIFASGSGTNAENIIRFFRTHPEINIKLVLVNKSQAGVLARAKNLGIDHRVFSREEFSNPDLFISILSDYKIDFIVLAGFLWLVPSYLIREFPDRIINIHPALLPKYGGKGMYGERVHEAVVQNGEKESGITIHYVNEHYDEGNIIFQARCPVDAGDTPQAVAEKVHALEYEWFPKVIEELLTGKGKLSLD
jgi:phosphoribosylglycinamide formyltransferase-1